MFWCRSFNLRWWIPLQYCDTSALPSNSYSSCNVGVSCSGGGCCSEFVVFEELWQLRCDHFVSIEALWPWGVIVMVLWQLRCDHCGILTIEVLWPYVHCSDHWGNMAFEMWPLRYWDHLGVWVIEVVWPFRCLGIGVLRPLRCCDVSVSLSLRWWTPRVSWITRWRRWTLSRCKPLPPSATCAPSSSTWWTCQSNASTPWRNKYVGKQHRV